LLPYRKLQVFQDVVVTQGNNSMSFFILSFIFIMIAGENSHITFFANITVTATLFTVNTIFTKTAHTRYIFHFFYFLSFDIIILSNFLFFVNTFILKYRHRKVS